MRWTREGVALSLFLYDEEAFETVGAADTCQSNCENKSIEGEFRGTDFF